MPAPGNLPSAVIKNSFLDGIFATIFGTMTSGVFLTGLAVDFLGSVELDQLHPLVEAPAVKEREEFHGKCDGVEGLSHSPAFALGKRAMNAERLASNEV
jgi:hypothetical protein